jgi:hypothetical protein
MQDKQLSPAVNVAFIARVKPTIATAFHSTKNKRATQMFSLDFCAAPHRNRPTWKLSSPQSFLPFPFSPNFTEL